jgi:hypothetical protein
VQGAGGWLVDTHWYDDHGNVVRSLAGAGRARVLAADAAERDQIASDAELTLYNDAGTRIEDEYGPVHTATLKDGTPGPFRSHTAYTYDDEAPNLGGGSKPAYDSWAIFCRAYSKARVALPPLGDSIHGGASAFPSTG